MPNTPSKRLVSLVRRAAILRAQGVNKFAQRNEVLKKAISAGLMVDDPIEVEITDKKAGIITKQKLAWSTTSPAKRPAAGPPSIASI